ncbi:MFS transporter [Burkholderia sp. Ac-20353]|uniref:MFS transporter n=1 Tax=Burkholderia sp. Ac-20353 TaxID=2703894 RepID=UPI00197C6612|nr:MFS transporter [Burkholderia sp. Ac-20353]MBN3786446.1 MHS family MFS transporter [Burkholderia sp. Ac-20353]
MRSSNGISTRTGIIKVAVASFIGTLIEYFDFFLFGTAAALVFNKIFFPNLNALTGTLASFAAFGAAFVARPLGGIIFGHFGDRLGRKAMLVISLSIVGVSTAMVGLLPTYHQVGILAPVLLVFFRILQGIAIGGEWSGAVLMAVEHAPPRKRAFYGSWPQCGIPAGLVLATASFYLVQKLPADDMMSWGWRVPFIGSAVLVLLGLYIRMKIEETPAFAAVREHKQEARFPVVDVVRTAPRPLLVTIFAIASPNILFYLATVFILRYAPERTGISRDIVLGAICAASFVQIFTIPLFALLADRYGRRPVLLVGSLLVVLSAYPFFWLIDSGKPVFVFLALMLALPLLHASTYSPIASFMPEQFETRLRYTGSAIGYQVGGLITSGPVPFVAAALFASSGASWPLALYIMIGGLLSLIAVAAARETYLENIAVADSDGGHADISGRDAAPEIGATINSLR